MATLRHVTPFVFGNTSIKGILHVGLNLTGKKRISTPYRALFTRCASRNTRLYPLGKSRSIYNIIESKAPDVKNENLDKRWATSSPTHTMDCFKESETEGSKRCHRDIVKLKQKCKELKLPKWEGTCQKTCLPCCKPYHSLEVCKQHLVTKKCKNIKYKYPSFVETAHKIPMKTSWMSDCCYWEECCPRFEIGSLQALMPLEQKQRLILGYPEKRKIHVVTNKKETFTTDKRHFTTSTNFQQRKSHHDCEKKGTLPCLKRGETALRRLIKSKKTCDKLCMPCCRPARDPPECYFPYVKEKCEKMRAPRAAFSECQSSLRQEPPCECLLPVQTCKKTSKDEQIGCHKR